MHPAHIQTQKPSRGHNVKPFRDKKFTIRHCYKIYAYITSYRRSDGWEMRNVYKILVGNPDE